MNNNFLHFINEQKKYFTNLYNNSAYRILTQTQINENCEQIINDVNKCIQQSNYEPFELKNQQFKHFGFFTLTQCENLQSFKYSDSMNKLNKTDFLTIVRLTKINFINRNYSIKYDGKFLKIKTE